MQQLFRNLIYIYLIEMHDKKRTSEGVIFAMHWEYKIYQLCKALQCHSYIPTVDAFVVTRSHLREVFCSKMEQVILDHYEICQLGPHIEEHLTDRTFNNRKGYGAVLAINTVISDIYEVSQGFTIDAWVIKLDFSGYFPNALLDIAYHQVSNILEKEYFGSDKDMLRYLLLVSIYSYPCNHCRKISPLSAWDDIPLAKQLFSKPDGTGAIIGRNLWQILMGLYCNEIDIFLIRECGLHVVRFVDDIVIVTDNKESMLAMLPIIRSKLATLGITLNEHKFYCQHYSKGFEFLGSVIKKDRVYVKNQTVRRCRMSIHKFNKKVKIRNIEAFISSMNSYLGIMKGRNAHNITSSLINEINPEWWRFVHFDKDRVCINANPGYTHKELLSRKYDVQFKSIKNGKNQRRTHRPARAA